MRLDDQNPYASPATSGAKPDDTIGAIAIGLAWILTPFIAGLTCIAGCCISNWMGRTTDDAVIESAKQFAAMSLVGQFLWTMFWISLYSLRTR